MRRQPRVPDRRSRKRSLVWDTRGNDVLNRDYLMMC